MADTIESGTAGEQKNPGTSSPAPIAVPRPHNASAAGHADSGNRGTEKQRKRNPVAIGIVVVAILVLGILGYRYWAFASVHASTDDAYLTTNVAQVTPQVAGTVQQILVNENERVKKGQLLAVLDDSTYKAAVAQAQANLYQAEAGAEGASVGVNLTQAQSSATVFGAHGGVQAARSSVATAQADVVRNEAALAAAGAGVSTAQSQVTVARASVAAARAALARAEQDVTAGRAKLATAQAGVQSAQSEITAAQANAARASADDRRYLILLREDVIAAQQYEAVHSAAIAAASQLSVAQQGLVQAKANVAQRGAELASALQEIQAAKATLAMKQADLSSAQSGVAAAKGNQGQAAAAVQAAQHMVQTYQAGVTQAAAQLQEADTAPEKVAVQRAAVATAKARIEQAKAALHTAEINLQRTRLYAPFDGRVSKKTAQLGEQVAPGQSLMALVPDNDLFVQANFKETQIEHMHPGQKVDIEVDTFPGITFKGVVQSISPGTGSTFTLLPPDNSTGNFTKVVQRVPVKVIFDPKQEHLEKLRAGLSASVTVSLR